MIKNRNEKVPQLLVEGSHARVTGPATARLLQDHKRKRKLAVSFKTEVSEHLRWRTRGGALGAARRLRHEQCDAVGRGGALGVVRPYRNRICPRRCVRWSRKGSPAHGHWTGVRLRKRGLRAESWRPKLRGGLAAARRLRSDRSTTGVRGGVPTVRQPTVGSRSSAVACPAVP